MKKILAFALCIAPSLLWAQNARIQGKIGPLASSNARIYLQYSLDKNTKVDSASLTNGSFDFNPVMVKNATKAMLIISPEGKTLQELSKSRMQNKQAIPPDYVDFFVSKGEQIQITSADSLKNATVNGSKLNGAYKAYQTELKPILEQLGALNAKVREVKPANRTVAKIMQPLEDQRKELVQQLAQKNLNYANTHPADYFSLVALTEYLRANPTDIDAITPVFAKLNASVKAEPLAQELAKTIQGNENSKVGNIIPEFQQNDFLNRPIAISDFKGKFTLIYFWASWCESCRETNKDFNAIYKAYNLRGFEILGVSLDKEKAEWTKAIRTDELLFTQVSDLNGWENSVAQKFGIKRIPDNILIGPDGKILARNLSSGELNEELLKLLANSNE